MTVQRNGKEPSLADKPAGEGSSFYDILSAEKPADQEVGDDEKDDICISIFEKSSRSSDSFIFGVPYQQRQFGNDDKDDVCFSIARLREKYSRSSNSFILKVPYQLRHVNPSAYEPRIISIGPYHYRNNARTTAMEIHKLSYLDMLLERRKENSPIRYVKAMRELEHDARSCYASTKRMSSKEFVQMLVLDGCFVIELISKFASDELRVEGNDLFKLNFNLSIVGQELLLVENQLPFFVLEELFNMTKTHKDETLVKMALKFFSGIVPGRGIPPSDQRNNRPIKHLLGLVHDNWLPSPKQPMTDGKWKVICPIKHLLGLVHDNCLPSPEQPVTDRKWKFIRSAKELSEVGIKFKKVSEEKTSSLFDINFQKSRFHIPTLTINRGTERIFRNLIAYEQQFNDGRPTYVMDYARFMDCLISTRDDVALLSECGIIDHRLGSDKEVACMFNKLNDFVYLSTTHFYYWGTFNEVNLHCDHWWTKMKVTLRSKYFDAPWHWVLIWIISGVFLFRLSSVETVYGVLSYYRKGS